MIIFQEKFPTNKKFKNIIISSIKNKLLEIEGKLGIDLFDLNLILDETIINAMEHGNKWDPDKSILIKIFLAENGIQVEIKDEGNGFDYFHEFEKPCLDERGRGLFLIRQICNIEWTDRGNIIKINIPVELHA
jgi:serine/threonine-protein kinase RsbW